MRCSDGTIVDTPPLVTVDYDDLTHTPALAEAEVDGLPGVTER